MKDLDKKIRKHIEEMNYDAVLLLLENRKDLDPYHTTLKGICIQITKNPGYTPQDAEDCFLKAIEIDGRYVRPYIELGYLYLTALKDKEKAEYFFDQAKEILKDLLVETFMGDFQIKFESRRDASILKMLKDFNDSVMNHKDIIALHDVLKKYK